MPEANNSYFYPSATASYVLSEDLDIDAVSFAKVRLGWAQVGNDTDPYRTSTTYAVNTNFGNSGSATIPNSQNNPNLRPEKTSSWEAGLELNLFLDRVRFDFTYYNSTTEDLIFNVPVSAASGYSSAVLNAGKTNNKGVEVSLAATVAQTDDFRWDIGANFAKNVNELVELADGIENIRYTSLFGTWRLVPASRWAPSTATTTSMTTPATSWWTMPAYYLRTDEVVPLGTILPNFTGGVYTTLDYKNLSFYAWLTSRTADPSTATPTSGASTPVRSRARSSTKTETTCALPITPVWSWKV